MIKWLKSICFFHEWKILKVVRLNWIPYKLKDLPIEKLIQLNPEPTTEIFYKCTKCSKVKTEDINGHWSLEELISTE